MGKEAEQCPAESQPQGDTVTTPPRMKRTRWLLNLIPNFLALLAGALGRIRASLRWPRRRKKGSLAQEETQLLQPEAKLDQQQQQQQSEEEEKEEGEQGVEEVVGAPQALPSKSGEAPEHFDIAFNFVRHLFDMLVVGFLCLASPVFRMTLDVLGLRGLVKLWLHGMALFLVVSYGMALVLWLLQLYIVQLALLFGGVQLMVLGVSIQHQEKADLETETRDLEDSIALSGP